jgi:DNA-binding MarR family transcriptional regulator
MKKDLERAQLAAWRGLLTTQAYIVAKIEQSLVAADLHPLTWYDVLFALYEQPDKKLRMAELAEKVLLSRSGLTRLVDRLEREGYLRREACLTDKRGLHVCLTDNGEAAMRSIWPLYRNGISEWFGKHLSAQEINLLTSVFAKINEPRSDA